MTRKESARASHGFRTTDKPCPECGETGHEFALVLGLKAILCPALGFGEMKAVMGLGEFIDALAELPSECQVRIKDVLGGPNA